LKVNFLYLIAIGCNMTTLLCSTIAPELIFGIRDDFKKALAVFREEFCKSKARISEENPRITLEDRRITVENERLHVENNWFNSQIREAERLLQNLRDRLAQLQANNFSIVVPPTQQNFAQKFYDVLCDTRKELICKKIYSHDDIQSIWEGSYQSMVNISLLRFLQACEVSKRNNLVKAFTFADLTLSMRYDIRLRQEVQVSSLFQELKKLYSILHDEKMTPQLLDQLETHLHYKNNGPSKDEADPLVQEALSLLD